MLCQLCFGVSETREDNNGIIWPVYWRPKYVCKNARIHYRYCIFVWSTAEGYHKVCGCPGDSEDRITGGGICWYSTCHLWSEKMPAGRWNYDPRTWLKSLEAPEQCGRSLNRGEHSVLEWAINYLSTSFQVSRDWTDGQVDGLISG